MSILVKCDECEKTQRMQPGEEIPQWQPGKASHWLIVKTGFVNHFCSEQCLREFYDPVKSKERQVAALKRLAKG